MDRINEGQEGMRNSLPLLVKANVSLLLPILSLLLSGCAPTRTVGIEQPEGSRQFIETTENLNTGKKSYMFIKAYVVEEYEGVGCWKVTKYIEEIVSGNEEIDKQAKIIGNG
jgi:hypothetical protein